MHNSPNGGVNYHIFQNKGNYPVILIYVVCKDGTACTPEERTGRVLHGFLSHLALGEVPVPGLEKVTIVGVDRDGRVHIMHSLFSVRVNVYSTECRLFA